MSEEMILVPSLRVAALSTMAKIEHFFLCQVSVKGTKIFKAALLSIALLSYLLFWGETAKWFSNEGIISPEIAHRNFNPYSWSVFFVNDSPEIVSYCYYLLLITLVMGIFNILPRVTAIISTILMISFYNRNPFVFNAGDMSLNFMMICACFINTKRPVAAPFRFIQIQICLMYFFAAFSKTSGQGWMSGEYVFWMINFPGRGYIDSVDFFRSYPALVNLMTYSVLAIEMSFPFLVWIPGLTVWMVGAAVMMHLGIDLTINTVFFSQIMWVGLGGVLVTSNLTKVVEK